LRMSVVLELSVGAFSLLLSASLSSAMPMAVLVVCRWKIEEEGPATKA
jgi:hypothetical protein